MKTNRIPYLNYLGINWYAIFKITPVIFILLVFESCKKEEISIDISPIVHAWEVIRITTPETGISQNATDTYLVEFMGDRTYSIDFDKPYCGGEFDVPENGRIHLEPLVDYTSSTCSITQYAKDLQKILISSNFYKINGDSLMLSGNGEIKLIRSMDCSGGGATGDGTVACTRNNVHIHMIIKWADGSDVLLTSSRLVRLSDSKTIHSSNYLQRQPDWPTNGYRLIDDSYRKDFAGKKVEVEYQGFIDDKMIVKSTFIITADCCHVSLVSGNLDIVVN